jgi:hypothetical protein
MFNLLPSCLCLSHALSQSLRNARIDARHQPRPPLKHLVAFLNQRSSFGVQRTVRIGLDEQTAYCNQHIPQGQLRIPVSLQRLDTDASTLRINIRMEDGRSEVGGRRALWVLGWNGQVKFPDALGERCAQRAGEEDVEVGERVGISRGRE